LLRPLEASVSAPAARDALRTGGTPMLEIEVQEYAHQLLAAYGDRAVVEAARRAVEFEQQKDTEEAKTWRHIEAALKAMRGPRVS
jgi:hypothetical protein